MVEESIANIRQRARQSAAMLLDRHWTTDKMPVDPVRIARSLGLSVFTAELGDDAWGMLVGRPEQPGGADIYLDRDQPRRRFRFSCAHEIGHFMDRDSSGENDTYFVDKRSDADKGKPAEVFANEFAGSLLMPEQQLKKFIARLAPEQQLDKLTGGNWDELEVSDYFDVSVAALRYRCQLLGVHLGGR